MARNKDSIKPAFQNGGRAVPPKWKLQDNEICSFEFFNFQLYVPRQSAILAGVALLR